MSSPKSQSADKRQAVRPGYQFKITLANSIPPIWRRILVPGGTLDDLHEWIQTAMGWDNTHLHRFEIGGTFYGDTELLETDYLEKELVDSMLTSLADLFGRPQAPKKFNYEYDFGDGWKHQVELESIVETVSGGMKPPCCIEGARRCPPEDVGGVWGYEDFLAAIRDPSHEEHQNYLEWAGDDFDPEKFDPNEATEAMRRGPPNRRD